MAEAKHSFVDDYPYLVYTAEQGTLVYSDKANTSIDDLPSGGGEEYDIKCYGIGGTAEVPEITELDPCAYVGEWDTTAGHFKPCGDVITKAKPGQNIVLERSGLLDIDDLVMVTSDDPIMESIRYMSPHNGATFSSCPMPEDNVRIYILAGN